MKIKGAIFDMDGTLVDSLMFWGYLWKRIGKRYFEDETFYPDESFDKRVRTMIYVDAMAAFKEEYGIEGELDDFLAFATEEIGVFYRTVAKAKDGAIELLEHLKGCGVKLCLASASAKNMVEMSLESCGLAKYFDAVLSCVDIGVSKDKPDIYLNALGELGLSAHEVCVVEDSYVALESAKSIGLYTVGVFDKYNYGQDRLAASANIYLGDNESLSTLIKLINT